MEFSPAFPMTLRMLAAPNSAAAPDWNLAREIREPWLARESTLVISTSGLPALYYLGRYELEYSTSHVQETETGEDFGIDERTGRPVISTASALKRMLACYPFGLFIDSFPSAPEGSIYGIDHGVAAVLAHAMRQLTLPDRARLRVCVGDRSARTSEANCSELSDLKPGQDSQ